MRSRTKLRLPLVLVILVAFAATAARAEIEITLKNTFIEKFKNRATIQTNFTVDKAHAKPNPPKKDADLHVAGRASEVGLPIVAEVMNAKKFAAAMDEIHRVEGTTKTIPLTGVWRIWCEHGGSSEQVQGAPLKRFTTTNPDHVFEIHPATDVAGIDVLDGFTDIVGFTKKDASQAFQSYENLSSKITRGSSTTTITTRMGGFNYVEFEIQLNQDPFAIDDGLLVMAEVHDLGGELLVRNRRMVFVKGTTPEQEVRGLHAGDRLHVIGVPRINLALVSWRTRNAKAKPEVLTWQLPYEMIIVAALEPLEHEEEEARLPDETLPRVSDAAAAAAVLDGGASQP